MKPKGETDRAIERRWARSLLRSLPGWQTVPPTTGTVTSVAYTLRQFAKEMKLRGEARKAERNKSNDLVRRSETRKGRGRGRT